MNESVGRRRAATSACLVIGLASVLVGCSGNPPQQAETKAAPEAASSAPIAARVSAGWTVTEGVDAPESAYIDMASGAVYVSQVSGMPDGRDGTGRIMKLGLDGQVIAANWVGGLNAPKGLRACDGTLWTADIDEVIGIDIATAMITSRLKIFGAKFLNDVACANDGTVYVSDMMATKIYAIKDGMPSTFAEGEELEYPNGLLVNGDVLVVGGWGKPEADFSTKVPGRLYTLDLKTKQKQLITPQPFANIDGVELDGHGGYVVTDWNAGKVFRVSATGESTMLQQYKQGTADHAFSPDGNVLIVPHMMENKVVAYDLSASMH